MRSIPPRVCPASSPLLFLPISLCSIFMLFHGPWHTLTENVTPSFHMNRTNLIRNTRLFLARCRPARRGAACDTTPPPPPPPPPQHLLFSVIYSPPPLPPLLRLPWPPSPGACHRRCSRQEAAPRARPAGVASESKPPRTEHNRYSESAKES